MWPWCYVLWMCCLGYCLWNSNLCIHMLEDLKTDYTSSFQKLCSVVTDLLGSQMFLSTLCCQIICMPYMPAWILSFCLECIFFYRVEARAALLEAIRMAQEANDHVCLQHALVCGLSKIVFWNYFFIIWLISNYLGLLWGDFNITVF